MPKQESQAIIELRKRLIELERITTTSIGKNNNSPLPETAPKLPAAQSLSDADIDHVSRERLLEIIQRLEQRIAELERTCLRNRQRRAPNEFTLVEHTHTILLLRRHSANVGLHHYFYTGL